MKSIWTNLNPHKPGLPVYMVFQVWLILEKEIWRDKEGYTESLIQLKPGSRMNEYKWNESSYIIYFILETPLSCQKYQYIIIYEGKVHGQNTSTNFGDFSDNLLCKLMDYKMNFKVLHKRSCRTVALRKFFSEQLQFCS